MDYLPIILIVAIFLCLLLLLRRKPKGTSQKPKPQIIPEYDSEEFEREIISEFSEPYNYKHVLLQRKRK